MSTTFSTIDEYIDTFEGAKKNKLIDLFTFIKEILPEATATINYKMPTFKLNGNLIHFAMFKNHLGVYPGDQAMKYFQDDLEIFKTTKGAIQLGLDDDIPYDLIQRIINYNVEISKDLVKPDWKKYNDQYADLTEKLVQLVNETDLVKEFKWGGDIYTYNNKNVLAFSGFKHHFSLWFHNGVFLEDKEGVLMSANIEKTKGLRQWRFKSIEDFNEDLVRKYIKEAIQIAKDGLELTSVKLPPKEPEGLLKDALSNDSTFKKAFQKLTPGRQKDYIEYIEEAKQEKTKITRLEKIKPMILDGKGLNDKYKSIK